MKDANSVTWDVIDVDSAHALAGCDEGPSGQARLLEDRRQGQVPAGHRAGLRRRHDRLFDIFAFNADVYKDNQPSSLMDLFDTKKYPGKRALLKKPFGNLEWALIADGVPAADVYKTLETPEGVDRASRSSTPSRRTSSGGKPAPSRPSCWRTAKS
jgi:putative spermidine/putrescine transport system substrate-binding protein